MAKPPYKILVVDDEPDLEPLMLQRMRRPVRAGQYQFVFAGNGLEALEKLREDDDIDMVISDINMPEMDGLTLLQQIPKIDPHIRAVIVSAYGDMDNIRTAMNRGAFDFVTKPIDFKDLRVTIDRTLRHLEEWREVLVARDQLVSLQNELSIASNIQQSILPREFPESPEYAVYGSMEPARNVGGDFFDVIRLDGGKLGLAIADVSDKGVPAALFMMSSRTLLKGNAISYLDPGKVLTEVNRLLLENNDEAMFITVLYAVLDPKSGKLTYANGGHNPPIILKADGSTELLPLTGGVALGVVDEFEFMCKIATLAPGDSVVLYTDGVTEAIDSVDEEFGLERLQELCTGQVGKSPREANMAILQGVKEFVGDTPQLDDITCMTFSYKGADS
jgi:sigma-B regulation protein RsbU (phosphoserine phosphatase)